MIRLSRWSHAESLSTTAGDPLEEEAAIARIAKCPDCARTHEHNERENVGFLTLNG